MGVKKATEKTFMRAVVQYARIKGWMVYHTADSRKSEEGFPDLVFVRPRRRSAPFDRGVVFAELKAETGETSTAQQEWIAALNHAGVPTYVWRPSDWPEIERVLGGA